MNDSEHESTAGSTRATWRGAVIAASDDVQVVDGYTYFPENSVERRYLEPSAHRTTCAWKGTASYFDVVVDGEVNRRAAWTYPDPSDRAAPLVSGRIAFWRGVEIERDGRAASTGGRLRRLLDRRT